MKKIIALAALALTGVYAAVALADDYHPPLHPTTTDHPPVTVTQPAETVTVTVDRPQPPPVTETITLPAETVTKTVTLPPKVKTVVKWKTRTIVKTKVKVVKKPCKPQKIVVPGCEGDCKKVFEGGNG